MREVSVPGGSAKGSIHVPAAGRPAQLPYVTGEEREPWSGKDLVKVTASTRELGAKPKSDLRAHVFPFASPPLTFS